VIANGIGKWRYILGDEARAIADLAMWWLAVPEYIVIRDYFIPPLELKFRYRRSQRNRGALISAILSSFSRAWKRLYGIGVDLVLSK
jgi:hypothetical protein